MAEVKTGLEPAEPQTTGPSNPPEAVTWTASEFISHEKSTSWYTGLIVVTILTSAIIYLITRDFISVAVVIVAALMFAVYGSHQPRQLDYRLDRRGIQAGPKHYAFSEFRTFSVLPEGAFSSIILMPLKRFGTPLTLYYAPEDEENIIALLSEQLPFERLKRDAIDSLMRRIRF